ncbi:MAG: hypothetical protein HFJ31_01470 [Clostridia bacterium]|jgi:hypothetical protein|nr:hypothetical protein [Clostridia bacterium]
MNQILAIENRKKEPKQKKQSSGRAIETRGIVRFFAIVIIIFGLVLIGEGSYAMYKEAADKNPANMPKVMVSREGDKVIVSVEHTTEISKVIYSWNNGEATEVPQGGITAYEEILLPNQNSILNITIEDMKGKKAYYQKEYIVEGMDITKPTINIQVEDGSQKMIITAEDETAIKYLSYQWEGEEVVREEATLDTQTKIEKEINLTPGTKKITIIAEDTSGNREQIEKEIIATTSKPKMQLIRNGREFIIEATDEDGITEIKLNLNGKQYVNPVNNEKYIKIGPALLQDGNNTILVEVTNINGYTEKAATEIKYPQ